MTRARRRALARRLAGPALGLAALAAVALWQYARYRSWVRGRAHYQDFASDHDERGACANAACPPLTPAQAALLGWATPSLSPQAYFRLPERKKPGVVRVGVFGCSFVAGVDAGPGQDFPNLLQKRLREAGYKNVEIVNFGVAGYGMDQSHMLWRMLHERYGLDVALFMPMGFHRERDVTFLFDENAYGPIHSRYALEDGRLLLITADQISNAQRSASYFRLVPPWRYWRYDDKPPAFLRSLLPAGRRWKGNPFYYRHDDRDKEALDTYVELMADVSRAGGRLVVDSDKDDLTQRLESRLGSRGVFFTSHIWDVTSPDKEIYYAPRGHLSAAGNWARSGVLFSLLTGKPDEDVLPTLAPLPPYRPGRALPPLGQAVAADARAGALPADTFVYYGDCIGCRVGRTPDFSRDGIAALLLTDGPDRPILGARLPLRDGEPVTLHVRLRGGELKPRVGVIRTADGVTGRLELSAPWIAARLPWSGREWRLDFADGDYVGNSTLRVPEPASDIWLGTPERRLLTGTLTPSGRISWRPAEAPYFLYLRAPEDGWIDLPRYRSAKTLDLVYKTADGRERRSPLYSIRWRRVPLKVPALPAALASDGKTGTIRGAR